MRFTNCEEIREQGEKGSQTTAQSAQYEKEWKKNTDLLPDVSGVSVVHFTHKTDFSGKSESFSFNTTLT